MKHTIPQRCEYISSGFIKDESGQPIMEVPKELEEQYRENIELDPSLAESLKEPVRMKRRGYLWSINPSPFTERDDKGNTFTYHENKAIVEDEATGRLYEIPIQDVIVDRINNQDEVLNNITKSD